MTTVTGITLTQGCRIPYLKRLLNMIKTQEKRLNVWVVVNGSKTLKDAEILQNF